MRVRLRQLTGSADSLPNPHRDKIATALCDEWNVFAVDLQNEPHAASWGFGSKTDWDLGASRIGQHVNAQCSRWLIMVEGVGYTPGAPGGDDATEGFWWGGNLVGAKVAPISLDPPSVGVTKNRLVYSPHTYGERGRPSAERLRAACLTSERGTLAPAEELLRAVRLTLRRAHDSRRVSLSQAQASTRSPTSATPASLRTSRPSTNTSGPLWPLRRARPSSSVSWVASTLARTSSGRTGLWPTASGSASACFTLG